MKKYLNGEKFQAAINFSEINFRYFLTINSFLREITKRRENEKKAPAGGSNKIRLVCASLGSKKRNIEQGSGN